MTYGSYEIVLNEGILQSLDKKTNFKKYLLIEFFRLMRKKRRWAFGRDTV